MNTASQLDSQPVRCREQGGGSHGHHEAAEVGRGSVQGVVALLALNLVDECVRLVPAMANVLAALGVCGRRAVMTRPPVELKLRRWPAAFLYFTGVFGCAASATALAQSNALPVPDNGLPIWGITVSCALAIGGWFLRGLNERIRLMEHDNKNIWAAIGLHRETVAASYHTKGELVILHERQERETREHREHVVAELRAMNGRLDTLFAAAANK